MRDVFKFFGAFLGVIFLGVLISWATMGNNFFLYKYFAPKTEQVRYDVFKQSQAYNDGMANQLEKYQAEWITSTPDQKLALKAIILEQFGSYNSNALPPTAYSFLQTVRNYQ